LTYIAATIFRVNEAGRGCDPIYRPHNGIRGVNVMHSTIQWKGTPLVHTSHSKSKGGGVGVWRGVLSKRGGHVVKKKCIGKEVRSDFTLSASILTVLRSIARSMYQIGPSLYLNHPEFDK
jgi:hypothetical protein